LAVVLAQANNKANHSGVLGLVTENINNNEEGFITTFGNISNIDTTGSLQGETWFDGDILWLSETTTGGLTNIEPTNHPIQIGYIIYSHKNNGKIFVRVENVVDELNELHDVRIIGTPSNYDSLVYNATMSVWENKTILLGRESDYVYPYHYSGTAYLETPTSSSTWIIKRIDFTTPGSPITLSKKGSWDNRYILEY